MRVIAYIFFMLALGTSAQDKLIFRDGSVRMMYVVSIAADKVYAKTKEGEPAYAIARSDLILIEQASGRRYLFAENGAAGSGKENAPVQEKKNMLGLQPFELFLGRATLVYERLSKNGTVGIVIPLSITYNPVPNATVQVFDSLTTAHLQKVGFITGFDINFYPGKNRKARFYIGLRFRYGTDVFLQNIHGYTLQTQLGWRFSRPGAHISQNLAFGFGFARIQSTNFGSFPEPKQAFGWYSVTYRFSFRW
jgi:hypothetical protein